MKCNETVTNRVIWYIGYLDGFWYVFLHINIRRKHQYSYIVILNSTSTILMMCYEVSNPFLATIIIRI